MAVFLSEDRFEVTLQSGAETSEEQLRAAVERLGYSATLADRRPFEPDSRGTSEVEVPESLRRTYERAKREHRLVVFDCLAPWCESCRRMEEETFRDPRVRALLDESCLFVRVNVEQTPEMVRYFETEGIPDI